MKAGQAQGSSDIAKQPLTFRPVFLIDALHTALLEYSLEKSVELKVSLLWRKEFGTWFCKSVGEFNVPYVRLNGTFLLRASLFLW